jgi:hypothetical protein
MKKLLASIILFGISITMAWSQSAKPSVVCTKRSWVLVITPQTKKQYIDSVATAWKADSINLKFSKLEYNDKGLLVKIKGSVDINGGLPSSTFGSDNLVSYEIKVEDRPELSVKGK